MHKNLILTYKVKETEVDIDSLISKVIADASLGTDYILSTQGQEFYPHKEEKGQIKAELIKREKIDDKTTRLIFKVPLFFESMADFFPMFMTCIGEPPSFHPNVFLEDFKVEDLGCIFQSSAVKLKKYLGREGPYVGTIIKPNLGTDLDKRLELIKKLMLSGADFLKDDEVFGLESFDKFKEYIYRVNTLKEECYKKTGQKCLVCFNITSYVSRLDDISALPIDGIMINHLALGFTKAYEVCEKLKDKCIIHGHRVGSYDFLKNNHDNVLLKLSYMVGLNSIHLGTPKIDNILSKLEGLDKDYLNSVVPVFTKVNPGYIKGICYSFGKNVVFLPCGGVYRHPDGFEAGMKAFKTAVDMVKGTKGKFYDKKAYDKAIGRFMY